MEEGGELEKKLFFSLFVFQIGPLKGIAFGLE